MSRWNELTMGSLETVKNARRSEMRIAYFDCFSGASGDMILGSMIDVGLNVRELRKELRKIPISDVQLIARKVVKQGISATRVSVKGKQVGKPHRNLRELLKIIEKSRLDSEIKRESREVFERIASVEAKIHRKPVEEIHFHELGGFDSIVDIVGSIWGFRELGIKKLYVSKVNVGSGFVKCEHGVLPVPAPATLALMKGKPIYSSGVERELLTPTGAALLTFLGSDFGYMPEIKVERIGYGAGRDDLPHPNLLRLVIGFPSAHSGMERVMVVETNIDDMNPQFYDYMIERLLAIGVMEVFLTPIMMKKNRPGTLLKIICPTGKLASVTGFLFKETTTLGVRWHEEERNRTDREIVTLGTRYGHIRFKLARWEGEVVNLAPEYEDCKRLAVKKKQSLKEVFEEARKAALAFLEESKSRHKHA
ncbi:MAG: nickel pincer cofactor biosynthesis protein LarC [Thermodesulfobacteriota bacterium]